MAVHREAKRVAMRMRNRAAYMWPPIGNETRGPEQWSCGAEGASAKGRVLIERGNEGWNPQDPGRPRRWSANEAAWVARGCTSVT